jgi:hypothetical protein
MPKNPAIDNETARLLELLKSSPELRKQLEQQAAKVQEATPERKRQAESYPRYVFDWESNLRIEEGGSVRVRNCFGQVRGGMAKHKVGRAWLVEFVDGELLVHDWEDAWE